METNEIKMEKMHPLPNAPPMYSLQQFSQFSQTPTMDQLRPQTSRPHTSRPETANVILVNSNTTAPVQVGHEAQRLTCPHCGVVMLTRLDYRSTYRTHTFALILCVTCLWCCAPLPYFMKSCKSLDHHCSNCSQFIGKTEI